MTKMFGTTKIMAALVMGFGLLIMPPTTYAHCDTLDGPVVKDARMALEKGDVTPILKWVMPDKEVEISAAFAKTMSVRKLGTDARELADMYLFETLVRIHREGESAPYTGLKPAGEVEPGIAAADKSLESGSVDELVKDVSAAVEGGIRQRFQHALGAKKQADQSVELGREYVEAYVTFIHYVERLHTDALGGAALHGEIQVQEPSGGHQH